MTKLLPQFIIAIVTISILGFVFLLAYKPWFKLSKTFGSKLSPPETFIEQQSCILKQTILQGYINVGIAEQKLYLSHTPPLSHFIHPLLIDWDAITKIESCFDSLLGGRCYKLFIGELNITTLILSQNLIEKLEEDYGEPIFSNKLRELN
ncbi:MAG: hypothetical protein AAF383_18285 [Cyanobacteria bacterium P01_A01_bin.83]